MSKRVDEFTDLLGNVEHLLVHPPKNDFTFFHAMAALSDFVRAHRETITAALAGKGS